MAILRVSELTKYYGAKLILQRVSFEVHLGERVALVGANGAGKSTLLKIIAGKTQPDSGSFTVGSGFKVSYLAQNKDFTLDQPLGEFLREPFAEIFAAEKDLLHLSKKIAVLKGEELEAALKEYNRLNHWFESQEGYQAPVKINTVFNGLGFWEKDRNRPVSSFSGGERTRAELARRLLEEPDLLILDEPTNHLDKEAVEWLEDFLKAYRRSVLVVSHDRYFLDQVAERVLHLEGGHLRSFRGNYSRFKEQLEEKEDSQERAYLKQQAYIKKEQDLIEGQRQTEKAQRFAKSRAKRLEKLDLVESPPRRERMHFEFPFAGRSGKIALRASDLSFFFDSKKPLFQGADFTVNYGDKVALLGPNGAGKTTLFKLILDELTPQEGFVTIGAGVKISYFPQAYSFIDESASVLDEILNTERLTIQEAREHLAIFLFKGSDAEKTVKNLSGGERSRLILAKLALSKSNFLLFDEPTNYLDIESLETFESALLSFPGTVLLISHDRYLVRKIARKIIAVEGGRADLYRFGYSEYLNRKKTGVLKEERDEKRDAQDKKTAPVKIPRRPRDRTREKERVLQLIKGLEAEKDAALQSFGDRSIADDWKELASLEECVKSLDKDLNRLYEAWIRLEEEN